MKSSLGKVNFWFRLKKNLTNSVTDEFGTKVVGQSAVKCRVDCFCVYFTELRQFSVDLCQPVKQCYV